MNNDDYIESKRCSVGLVAHVYESRGSLQWEK